MLEYNNDLSKYNNNKLKAIPTAGKNLNTIIATREQIAEACKTEIVFSEPFISLNGDPVFYPNTINVIQGKAGVHKSRLAELICSAILKNSNCKNELLGFSTSGKLNFAICYVDTERNIKNQVPYSLQQIKMKAGFEAGEDLPNFEGISLLEVDRDERFEALNEYIHFVRSIYTEHLILVLDVITDCISSFNDAKESMELIDLMNLCINKHDVTFICLIHENPGAGSEKARGHLGTEITNKASTVIQVGFEKGSDIIKINFIKCRNSKRPMPTYAYYSEIEKGLVLADSKLVQEAMDNKREKATIEQVKKQLTILLTGAMSRSDLYKHLLDEFNCSERTITGRLTEIIEGSMEIKNMKGEICLLTKDAKKETIFRLVPILN